jgi:hypothetical protein
MPKVKISEYSATANSNTDVASINIDEGCAPSGINNAIRAVMGHLKDFQQGTNGDPFNGPHNGTVGATTPSTGAFTTLSASSTVTLSGGTINGVAFLNGSNVLTTGSALVFNGTNLGVGATPSAFTRRALEIGDAAAAYVANNSGGATVIATNMYFDGSNKYATTAAAARYSIGTGTYEWYNAPSGTAGNAITFTQAMTLNASGNLGIGTTTPVSRLDVRAPAGELGRFAISNSGVGYLLVGGGSSTTEGLRLSYDNSDGSSTINNFFNAALKFSTNNILRATLDASGNLLVGATSGTGRLVVTDTATTQISIVAASGTGFNARLYMECPGINAGGFGYVRSTSRLYAWNSVEDSGPYVVASGTSWTTNSDARLKTNVQNISYGIDAVLALSPKEYEYKIDQGKKCLGFIAQDVVAIIPELVDVPEDSSEMMGIEYQAFIPVLVKAIQEQQALITQLTARITALESA